MASLIRKSRSQLNADLILRKLLKKWHDSSELTTQLELIVKEAAITLSEGEHQRIKDDPVDYLLGMPVFVRLDPDEPPRSAMIRYVTHQLLSRGFDTRSLENPDTFHNKLFRHTLREVLGELGAALSETEQHRLFEDLRRELYG